MEELMDRRKQIQISNYVPFRDYESNKIDLLSLGFNEIKRYLLQEIRNKEIKIDTFKVELTAIIHEDEWEERIKPGTRKEFEIKYEGEVK